MSIYTYMLVICTTTFICTLVYVYPVMFCFPYALFSLNSLFCNPWMHTQWCGSGSGSAWIRRLLRPWIRIRNPHTLRIRIPDPKSFLVISKNIYVHVEILYKFPSTSSLFPISFNTRSKKAVCLLKYNNL